MIYHTWQRMLIHLKLMVRYVEFVFESPLQMMMKIPLVAAAGDREMGRIRVLEVKVVV